MKIFNEMHSYTFNKVLILIKLHFLACFTLFNPVYGSGTAMFINPLIATKSEREHLKIDVEMFPEHNISICFLSG